RGFSGNKSELSDSAQNIVRQSPKCQDQGIGGEFARWEPFHIHVGLDLSMELLACATPLVKPDYILFGQIKCGPPSFDFNFRPQKTLPAPVNGTLDCPHNPFEPVGLFLVNLLDIDGEQPNSFSISGSSDRALIENPSRPLELVFSSWIPFDDVADFLLARQGNTAIKRIVGRVQAHQKLSGGKAAGFLDDPLNERDESLLAMLAALTQFQLQAPPFRAHVPCHGSIPVLPVVDTGHSLLFGLRVVHGKDIAIKGEMPGIERGDGHLGFFQEFHRANVSKATQGRGNLVQALPQRFSGGDACNSQGLTEVVVVPAVCYGFKIAFPHCQKPHIATHDIVKTNAADLPWKSIDSLGRQGAQPVQTQPYESQARVRGIEFLFGLRDDELLHAFTSQVSYCEVT